MTYFIGRDDEEYFRYAAPMMTCLNPRNSSLGINYADFDNACQNIPLPFPILPAAGGGLPGWPPDGWSKNFACIDCGHVYVYAKADVYWVTVPKLSAGQFRNETNCFSVELRCGRKGCAIPVKFHIEIFDKTEDDLKRDIRKGFVGNWPSCGHPAIADPFSQCGIQRVYQGPIE